MIWGRIVFGENNRGGLFFLVSYDFGEKLITLVVPVVFRFWAWGPRTYFLELESW